MLFPESKPNSVISCTGCRILLFLSPLILKPFISRDSSKVSLQGFCFFDLYFYTLKSQLRYPSLIPFLTLHYLTGLTLHLSGLGWIPTQVMGVPGQSNPSTESQGDTSHGAAAGQTSPLNSPPFELLTPLLFSTEGLLWVRFVLLRKSCLR